MSANDKDTGSAGRSSRSPTRFLPLGLILAASTGLFLQTKDFGFLGFDSYPLIVSSRVQSFADFLGTFTESLMESYYPVAFYRPLLKLSFAADYAVWGLEPLGYQLSNVIVFAGCALALYALARRLAGPRAWVAPWVALLVFLLHPVHHDVVPIPPRRAEMLACAFMILSIYLQLSPRALRLRFPLWPAVATLLAIASKETAFILPPVSFVAVLLYVPCARWPARLARAASALVPHLIVVLAMLALRAGMGFIGTAGLAVNRDAFQRLVGELAGETPLAGSTAARWVLLSLTVAVLVGFALTLFGWAGRDRKDEGFSSMRSLRAEIVPLTLVLAVLVLTYSRVNPWKFEYQYFIPVAGWALLLGAVAQRIVRFGRGPGLAARLAAVVMIVLLAMPALWQARFSPLVHHYGEGESATAVSRSFLKALRQRVLESPDGAIVHAPPLPRRVPPSDPLRSLGTTILADYSVQAWVDLSLPDRRVRVVFAPTAAPQDLAPAGDEVLVLLSRTLPGF